MIGYETSFFLKPRASVQRARGIAKKLSDDQDWKKRKRRIASGFLAKVMCRATRPGIFSRAWGCAKSRRSPRVKRNGKYANDKSMTYSRIRLSRTFSFVCRIQLFQP